MVAHRERGGVDAGDSGGSSGWLHTGAWTRAERWMVAPRERGRPWSAGRCRRAAPSRTLVARGVGFAGPCVADGSCARRVTRLRRMRARRRRPVLNRGDFCYVRRSAIGRLGLAARDVFHAPAASPSGSARLPRGPGERLAAARHTSPRQQEGTPCPPS